MEIEDTKIPVKEFPAFRDYFRHELTTALEHLEAGRMLKMVMQIGVMHRELAMTKWVELTEKELEWDKSQ